MNGSGGYGERFAKVFDYIDAHLGEELSVERLSQVANFSKFHFHRQFSNYAGISVSRYVQMMRLKRAAYRLALDPRVRIIEVALEAGFETPESFSRAFKRDYGQTPSQFRVSPSWKPWGERYQFPGWERRRTMDVKIADFGQTKVAVLEHRGPPELVNSSARKFIEWRKESGLSPVKSSKTFGIAYDDPDAVAAGGVPLRHLRLGDFRGSGEPARRCQQGHPRRPLRGAAAPGRPRQDRRKCQLSLQRLATGERRRASRFPGCLPLPESKAGNPGSRADYGHLFAREIDRQRSPTGGHALAGRQDGALMEVTSFLPQASACPPVGKITALPCGTAAAISRALLFVPNTSSSALMARSGHLI